MSMYRERLRYLNYVTLFNFFSFNINESLANGDSYFQLSTLPLTLHALRLTCRRRVTLLAARLYDLTSI